MRRTVPSVNARLGAALVAVLASCLVACGGGADPSGVTTLSAGGLAYGRQMTVTVSGSGLADPGLQMTVDGPCVDVARSTGASDFQVQFTCTVTGVGTLSPRVRNGAGTELARLTVSVPLPQVSMAVRQGTRSGTLLLELDPAAAPATVANFMRYVNGGFYRDTLLHRVVADKLAQGGGYVVGPTPKAATLAPIVLETTDTGLKNERGTIAMARANEPDSATSQFYFNIATNPEFDRAGDARPGYAVFGRVVTGLDVLDEIGRVPTRVLDATLQSLPVDDVVVTSVLQVR